MEDVRQSDTILPQCQRMPVLRLGDCERQRRQCMHTGY